ncbi:MAG: FimV/HubP family polar landmark protein [Spongiibacteraceae bacterium]
MVRKKLAAAIAAIGALQAGVVSALGMGEFSLHSALNQPLDAEIRLLNTEDLDNSQVLIKLATTQDFKNAGVSRDFFLTNIKFNVEVDGKGGGVIKVTTREAVVEPYLNFLVEAHWPSGRLLREYTVLLDLPVFSDSNNNPVSTASASRSVVGPATRTPTNVSRNRLTDGELAPGKDYRVKNDDTLWEIALKSRPEGSASVQQTMVGIQRLNPNAFINGNINRLKAGSVLRLPTADDISVSEHQAVGEVASQNKAWRQGGNNSSTMSDAQLDATTNSNNSSAGAREQPRLSIASSGASDSSGSGEGLGNGAGNKALQDQLAVTEENLDKTQRDNEELQSRLGDMEAKLATLQRLIELKDDQLAALQAGVAEEGFAAAPNADSAEEQLPADDVASSDDIADTAELTNNSVAPEESEAEPEPEAKVNPPVASPTAEPSFIDQVSSNFLYIGGAGLLILAAAIVLMRRRKADTDEEDFDEAVEFEQEEDVLAEFAVADTVMEDSDELVLGAEDDGADTDLLVAELEQQIAADNAEEAARAEQEPERPVISKTVESETGDAIAEADIYVAYGRYQQAIDLLQSAIEKEPLRSDLQIKQLEVFIEMRDKPSFQQHFVALLGLNDEAAIVHVKEMLSSVDGVAGWLDDLPGSTASFSSDQMDAELIEGGDELDDIQLNLDDTEEDFDLDLDLDLDDISLASTQENPSVSLDDLVLDDDMLDLSEELDFKDDIELDAEADLITDSDTASLGSAELELPPAEADGLDLELNDLDLSELDLDGDDLDLDSLGDTDLDDLAAEFDDLDTDRQSIPVLGAAAALQPEDDTELTDLADDFEFDLDDDDLTAKKPEELEFDLDLEDDLDLELDVDNAAATSNLDELDLELDDLDLELDDSVAPAGNDNPTVTYNLDDVAAELDKTEATDVKIDTTAGDDDFDFLADSDEVATKLDLARAYIDMGDTDGARDILDEVISEGNDEQKQEASGLLERID